jgi:DNA-binding transcriptional LysR family regulator
MDLRQLNSLLAVVDHGGFSSAGRALHTVQSNVSAHVARLEKELGVLLIDRATGSLTEEGAVVVERTRRIQAELDALIADVASVRDQVAGLVRIGLIGTTARWIVPTLVEQVARRHPLVCLEVHDATTSALTVQLEAGEIDLAVVTMPVTEPGLTTELLFGEDRLLAVSAGHSLQGRTEITLGDLDGMPLILEPASRPFRQLLETLMTERGYSLVAKAEIDGTRLMTSMVFEGFGAAIVPATAIPLWLGGNWRTMTIEGLAGRSVGLATRRKGLLSTPARAVRDVLREVIADRATRHPGIHPARLH